MNLTHAGKRGDPTLVVDGTGDAGGGVVGGGVGGQASMRV